MLIPLQSCALPLITHLHINCFKRDVAPKFLNHHLFKIHECFWILSGMVELSKKTFDTFKKKKTLQVCMRTGIWPEILWNSLLFCLWKALEAPSVSSRLSLYFFVCLSPHACVYSDSLPSLGWWREPCLCGHRCVNVHCLVISGYHNQYSETVSAGSANILLIFKLGLAKTCMWNTFFPL